ncbi:MAG: D-alanine--D-serine ligase VanG [Lachnospiraceae bacterium]|nr:D-alanine--D-serine ligase VanG [Lachnospiraceae bacterium]
MTHKTAVAILFGGCSTEYEVSLQSAYSVISYLDQTKYEAHLIGITREGTWLYYQGDIDRIPEDTWSSSDCFPTIISPNRTEHGLYLMRGGEIELIHLDAVFPVLHGKNGEDGTVQGLCELAGIPIVGCGMESSVLGMNKHLAHTLVSLDGIEVPKSIHFKRVPTQAEQLSMTSGLTYPLYVKPVKAGSSFGITKVGNPSQLEEAIHTAFSHDDTVIVEESIPGFEVGCAVLGNENLIIGEVDEIELSDGFFDYTEKYTLKTSKIHMPARIDSQTADRIRETAGRIYRILSCKGLSRVDMFLTPDGRIVFNEVNTIPGFTSHSRYPNMLKGIGMTFEEIIDALIRLAVEG